jgi:outer membrane protein OmpA-like peptidoglycan-associated protein
MTMGIHIVRGASCTPVKAEVRGHTDSQGDAAKNLELSQQRAQAVVDYLVQKGIVVARLTAKGLGETVPIADNNTDAGRAKNRRVEFAIAP